MEEEWWEEDAAEKDCGPRKTDLARGGLRAEQVEEQTARLACLKLETLCTTLYVQRQMGERLGEVPRISLWNDRLEDLL